jgi:hypothetical protein
MKSILCITTHPFPGIITELQKYGYHVTVLPLFEQQELLVDEQKKLISVSDITLWFYVPGWDIRDVIGNYSVFIDQGLYEPEVNVGIFDWVITGYPDRLNSGAKKVDYWLPYYEQLEERIEYDVSFFCSDLFEQSLLFKSPLGTLEELTTQKEFSFAVHGPSFLKYRYPEHYKDKKLGKINLVLPPRDNYVNVEELEILSQGGLLLTSRNELLPAEGYLFLEGDIVMQIKNILSNLSSYNSVRTIGKQWSSNYSLNHWCYKLHSELCLTFFDHNFYRELYNIPINIVNLPVYWKEQKELQIPYIFKVPEEFDLLEYKRTITADNKKDAWYYWHYRVFNQDPKFLIPGLPQELLTVLDNCNIDLIGWSKLVVMLEEGDNLGELNEIINCYPGCNLDRLVRLYFQLG